MNTEEARNLKIEEWLDFFKKNTKKKLFSTADLQTLTGEKRPSMSVQLSRLVGSGLIERPVRGWYVNPFRTPSDEELAMVIRNPSYLSMEYALSKHDLLSQRVYAFTLVTTKLPYSFQTHDQIFEYHQVKKSLFWGYKRDNDFSAAEPEKALLDLIYIRAVRGQAFDDSSLESLIDDMYLEDLDRKKLLDYSKRFDKTTRKILSVRSLI